MYDLAIIGAGPAGATLGRLVGSRLKTILIDRRRLTNRAAGRRDVKSCGGLVAPDAQKMLAHLGLGLPRSVLVGPQVFAVRAVDLPSGLQRTYPRHYINIDRGRFDRWLVSLLPPEVELAAGWTVKRIARADDGVTIEMASGGQTRTLRARRLVGAGGAASTARRRFAPRHPSPRRYVSVQETLVGATPCPYFSAYFDPEITDFYAWSIPKGDSLLLGAALPAGKDANRRFDRLKARLVAAGLVGGTPVAREGSLILRPLHAKQLCPVAGPALLIGEAAGWISPSSAEGLSYAFCSALAAAEALGDGEQDFADRYRRATRPIVGDIVLKNLKRRLIYTPPARRLAMRVGLGALFAGVRGPAGGEFEYARSS